jgi:hypothetical protein
MTEMTILYADRARADVHATVAGEQLWLSPTDFYAATGWKLETAGLCKGDACVQVQPSWVDGEGQVDLSAFAAHMGQPIVRDEPHQVWAFGESVNVRRDALFGHQAPDFSLPDLDGKMHALSDYRGKKVFLHSWGSY